MYEKLMDVVMESGIWEGRQRYTHAFLLSPDVYSISEAQRDDLTALGHAITDCLRGLSHIAVIAYDETLNYKEAWLYVRRLFSAGVPKVYHELQGLHIKHIPQLLKVDLLVDVDGNFKIAEIDGHNKHGLGYSTLGRRFREAVDPDAVTLPGAVKSVADEVKRLGTTEVKLLYADQEKFYIPEFLIAQSEFAKHGITCIMLPEMETEAEDLTNGVFLDLPFLYHRDSLYQTIIPAYQQGDVHFIIPPKPFFGAKTVLALLRNDGKDERLEALLMSFIKRSSLERVRSHIPETFVIGKQAVGIDVVRERVAQKRYVLKKSIASGMKGVIFSDDPAFETALVTAGNSNMNWILQEEVVNQPRTFSWIVENEGNLDHHTSHDWFMRVTAHYVNRTLADVVVTARRDKSVHGAKDSIQIGAIVR